MRMPMGAVMVDHPSCGSHASRGVGFFDDDRSPHFASTTAAAVFPVVFFFFFFFFFIFFFLDDHAGYRLRTQDWL